MFEKRLNVVISSVSNDNYTLLDLPPLLQKSLKYLIVIGETDPFLLLKENGFIGNGDDMVQLVRLKFSVITKGGH